MEHLIKLKCPSCGSSVIETEKHSIAICSHCGSKLIIKNKQSVKWYIKYPSYLIGSMAFIIAMGVFAFYVYQKINSTENKPDEIEIVKKEPPVASTTLPIITHDFESIVRKNTLKKDPTNKPEVLIVHQVQGKTSNGGIYWIVTIRNNSQQIIYRPGAIISLFDENYKRIEEQKGWSKQAQLEPQSETDVLVLITHPPQGKYTSQLSGMGSYSTFLTNTRVSIDIVDFFVKAKPNNASHFEIIGDVKNNHDLQVDFVRVVAIAKDAQNNSIGLADGFVSTSNLQANTQSGFKLTAGTFVTGTPASWSLFAYGQKHREKL